VCSHPKAPISWNTQHFDTLSINACKTLQSMNNDMKEEAIYARNLLIQLLPVHSGKGFYYFFLHIRERDSFIQFFK
jgi:hypothetical protein